MVQAPVGWHCKTCVRREARQSPVIRYRPSVGTTRLTPVVLGLILINLVIYVAELVQPAAQFNDEMVPLFVRQGDWYRVITSAFIHYSWAHVGLNMVSLAMIGPAVEQILGRWRFLVLYLVAAVGGSVAVYLVDPALQPSAGASGAIFGVFAAYYVLARKRGFDTSAILGLIIVNLVFGFVEPGISWQDHLGGMLTGALLAYLAHVLPDRRNQAYRYYLVAAAVAALFVLVIAVVPPGQVNLGG
jgi:membrane associated rhomboid family serine protease